jgi:hypothetical protein
LQKMTTVQLFESMMERTKKEQALYLLHP